MATKIIKLNNGTDTYVPVTVAGAVQYSYATGYMSVQEAIGTLAQASLPISNHINTEDIDFAYNAGNVTLTGVHVNGTKTIKAEGLTYIKSDGNNIIIGTTATDKTGTVTSVTITQGDGITVSNSGSAITTSGTRTITHATPTNATSGEKLAGTGKYFSGFTTDKFGHVTAYSTADLPSFTDTNTTVLTNGTDTVTADHKSSQKITLTGDTNKFTVSQGSTSFDVSVTPSISNNVTGSAAWTKASYLTATNAASGNVIKQSTLAIDDVATKNYVADEIGKLGKALNWVGVSTTDPVGGSGATVSGHTTWKSGDVVGYNSKEYVLTGTSNAAANWRELGDESSWAMTGTTTCSPGDGMTGSTTTVNAAGTSGVIDHAIPTGASAGKKNSASNNFLTSVTTDKFGHITAYTTGTYSVTHQTHSFTDKAAATTGDYELKLNDSNSSVYFTPSAGIKLTAASNKLTIAHNNSITAVTTAALKKFKYDAQGHITGVANVSTNSVGIDSLKYQVGNTTDDIDDTALGLTFGTATNVASLTGTTTFVTAS